MRWFKPNLRSSINAIFGLTHHHRQAASDSMLEIGIQDIREAMLELMGEMPDNPSPLVTRRIRYAVDIQALWYLRGDLMGVLAKRYGEAAARAKLEPITAMFADLGPLGLRSRPSPLSALLTKKK
ncbi:MAG: hypothetical protein ABI409_20285 [Ramlibacter sp.]